MVGVVSIRIDTELKKSAEELFNVLGISLSVAINIFLKSAVNHNGIPFEVRLPEPNVETQSALDEYEEMKKNPSSYKRYTSFDDMAEEL